LVSGELVFGPFASGSSGTAVFSLAVPDDPMLLGLEFFNQALVTSPGANAGGLIVTQGGHGVVGI